MREHWQEIYRQAPELFAELCRYEDLGGRAIERLCARAGIAGRGVLDLGCGTGRLFPALAARARQVVGVDRERGLLAFARGVAASHRHTAVVEARLATLPFADAVFDAVVASHVLAYLPARGQRAAIEEALRVLRPGGALWALEGHWQGEWMELRGRASDAANAEAAPLLDTHSFTLVDEVETRFCFPDLATARRVLGAIVGEPALDWLAARRDPCPRQRVVILRHPRDA
jgi:SAM-dependent methyltransferase